MVRQHNSNANISNHIGKGMLPPPFCTLCFSGKCHQNFNTPSHSVFVPSLGKLFIPQTSTGCVSCVCRSLSLVLRGKKLRRWGAPACGRQLRRWPPGSSTSWCSSPHPTPTMDGLV